MKIAITMPQMGQSVAEGVIVKWRKAVGDEVAADEIVVDVESDKISFEIESPAAGRLSSCLKREGEVAAVGDLIGEIDDGEPEEHSAGATTDQVSTAGAKPHAGGDQPQVLVQAESAGFGMPRRAELPEITREWLSPYLMRMALMNDVSMDELQTITGTGKGGRLTKADLMHYLSRRPVAASSLPGAMGKPEPSPREVAQLGEIIPMTAIRKTIADHMIQSIRTSAHVTMVHAVDMTSVVALREQMKQAFADQYGVKMTYTTVLTFVTARVLRSFPNINASVFGSNIVLRNEVNIGCAVALPDESLVVPVLHGADTMTFPEVAQGLDRLFKVARDKALTRADVEGGTFTISNFGAFGSLIGTPIINQPQVAILGMGSIYKAPVVIDNQICIRDQIYLSFTFDHRVIDGAMGGRFLNAIQRATEALDEGDLDLRGL